MITGEHLHKGFGHAQALPRGTGETRHTASGHDEPEEGVEPAQPVPVMPPIMVPSVPSDGR
jgi:hypothetical protein